MTQPRLPRGRPPDYVKDRGGKPVVGLSVSSQGRYYATHSHPRKTFGRDFDQALMGFRQWEAKQATEPMAAVRVGEMPRRIKLPRELSDEYVLEQLNAGRSFEEIQAECGGTFNLLPADALFAWARSEILRDPTRFAERTGIPQLSNLKDLKTPPPSPTLRAVVKLYVEKAQVRRHERQRAARFWEEFRRIAKAKTIRDITQEQVAEYYDWVLNSGNSQTWMKHRLGKIKTVLRFAQTRGIAPEDIDRVLAYCRILVPPRPKAADPRPISPEHFRALLDVADGKWQAILLCSLNFCMYGKEVADLDRADVDLKARTLQTDRSKTGMTRIAVLWSRTARALRLAPQHHAQSLFVNQAGTRYHPDHIRRGFARLREAAGLPDDIKISDIRDGAYSAAVAGGADLTHAKLLAGHQTGMSDYYVRRNPRMVADACRAIELHYFGDSPPKGKTRRR